MCQRPAPSNPHHSNTTGVADNYTGLCKAALTATNTPKITTQPGLVTGTQGFTMRHPTVYFPHQEDTCTSFAQAAAADHWH